MTSAIVSKRPELTQQRLRELLDYDAETGEFRWRVSQGGKAKAGDKAGCRQPRGYWKIRIDGKDYRPHRLAFLYAHGRFPSQDIDHRNGIRHDNRLSNLREATRSENLANGKVRRLGLKGVHFHKRQGKWQAQIQKNGKNFHLGTFDTELEAHAAYVQAANQLHGEFARAA